MVVNTSTLISVSKIGRQIIIRFPYYGMFLSTLNKTVNNGPMNPTAGVSKNGLNTQLSINEKFWAKQSIAQRTGLMIHELLHICFFHITMRQSFTDFAMFNIAADLEINQYVEPLKDVELPKGALMLKDYGFDPIKDANKGTRFYYEAIRKKLNGGTANKNLKGLYKSLRAGTGTVCDHKLWKDFQDLTESEKRVIDQQIKTQMKASWENIDKSRGEIPNALREVLDEMLKPKKSLFDWKGAIRRFTGGYSAEIYTKKLRRKENKRFPDFPGLKIKHLKNLLCAVDTSGSVSHQEFIDFMKEIDVIRRSGVLVTVCECDAYVDKEKGVYEFKGLKQLKERQVTGGGGTSFDPPIEFLNEKANKFCAIIYLTDGYAPTPVVKPRKPIMWVLSTNGKTVKQCKDEGFPGYIIRIPKEKTN